MSVPIHVADLPDLPPGKGKVVEAAGRRITVFNREGRLYATAAPHPHAGPIAPGIAETLAACPQPGLSFDVFAEDSPAMLRADAEACRVRVVAQQVWVDLP